MYVHTECVCVSMCLQVAGRTLQEAMEENDVLTILDLRLTEISQQSEYSINQAIAANQERAKTAAANA